MSPSDGQRANDFFQRIKSEFEKDNRPLVPFWMRIINDKQWNELSRLSGLPAEARRQVAIEIVTYRSSKVSPTDLAPSETRLQLEQTAGEAYRLIKAIDRLYENGAAMFLTGNEGWELVRIDKLWEELIKFVGLLERASGRLEPARPGPRNNMLLELVRSLGDILHKQTETKLSRSHKRHGPSREHNALEFVIRTVRIAEPGIEDTTIENAVRKVMSRGKDNTRRNT